MLEDEVDKLLVDYKDKDTARYKQEHEENDAFYDDVVKNDKEKFENHYAIWKESVVRFHKLKQEDAISKCLARMNSEEFVNPPSRVAIFKEMKEEQQTLFEARVSIITELNN